MIVDNRVWAAKIHVLKDAGARVYCRKRLDQTNAGCGHNNQLAWCHRTNIGCANDVERNRFRGKDRSAVEVPHNQRADTQRVTTRNHSFACHTHERVGALDLFQRVHKFVEQRPVGAGRDKVDNDLGVAGRLKD